MIKKIKSIVFSKLKDKIPLNGGKLCLHLKINFYVIIEYNLIEMATLIQLLLFKWRQLI